VISHRSIFIDVEESKLSPIPKWRMIYIKSRFLELNWVKGHYNVLPTLRAHETRVSAFDSDGKHCNEDGIQMKCIA